MDKLDFSYQQQVFEFLNCKDKMSLTSVNQSFSQSDLRASALANVLFGNLEKLKMDQSHDHSRCSSRDAREYSFCNLPICEWKYTMAFTTINDQLKTLQKRSLENLGLVFSRIPQEYGEEKEMLLSTLLHDFLKINRGLASYCRPTQGLIDSFGKHFQLNEEELRELLLKEQIKNNNSVVLNQQPESVLQNSALFEKLIKQFRRSDLISYADPVLQNDVTFLNSLIQQGYYGVLYFANQKCIEFEELINLYITMIKTAKNRKENPFGWLVLAGENIKNNQKFLSCVLENGFYNCLLLVDPAKLSQDNKERIINVLKQPANYQEHCEVLHKCLENPEWCRILNISYGDLSNYIEMGNYDCLARIIYTNPELLEAEQVYALNALIISTALKRREEDPTSWLSLKKLNRVQILTLLDCSLDNNFYHVLSQIDPKIIQGNFLIPPKIERAVKDAVTANFNLSASFAIELLKNPDWHSILRIDCEFLKSLIKSDYELLSYIDMTTFGQNELIEFYKFFIAHAVQKKKDPVEWLKLASEEVKIGVLDYALNLGCYRLLLCIDPTFIQGNDLLEKKVRTGVQLQGEHFASQLIQKNALWENIIDPKIKVFSTMLDLQGLEDERCCISYNSLKEVLGMGEVVIKIDQHYFSSSSLTTLLDSTSKNPMNREQWSSRFVQKLRDVIQNAAGEQAQ